ncbi:MAG: hypothetical protein WCO00_16025 [Rhodospirillaceae bacterium]
MSVSESRTEPADRPSLLASGVSVRLAGALAVAAGLWLAVAWALGWIGSGG